MFKYAVNCAFEPLAPAWPTVLRGTIEENIRDAAQIGYDGLELFMRNPKSINAAHIKRLGDDAGIAFAAISTGLEYTLNGLCLIDENPEKRTAAINRLKEHIDFAAEIKSCLIVGIMRGNIPDFSQKERYLGYLSDALDKLCDYAKTCGVEIVVEAIIRYINNYLCTVPETVDYLKSLKKSNLGVHIDSHHMNVEDPDIKNATLYCGNMLKYVHFSDSNRTYPGSGSFDYKTMMKAMMDLNYKGYIAVECPPLPSPYECADRALRYMKHLQALIEIERLPLH